MQFLCSLQPKYLDGLVKTLRDVVNSPYAPEYDIAGITDPFLHIRLLKLLRVLGQGDADASDCMNDILAQVSCVSRFFFPFLSCSVWSLEIFMILTVLSVISVLMNGNLRFIIAIFFLGGNKNRVKQKCRECHSI